MAKDPLERPESIQIARKFVDATSNIRDTMVRYDLERMRARPRELSVELAGTSDECDQRYPLREGKTTVGRGDSCDIHIEAGHVSRLHATLLLEDGVLTLRDEGSSNGTYVNGARLSENRVLTDGDLVHFGPVLRFVVVIRRPDRSPIEVPAPAAPPPDEASGEATPVRASPDAMELLDRERGQLALLLQVAMRYLAAGPEEDPIGILFEVLSHVVAFDAAFVATSENGTLAYYAHPSGLELDHAAYARLAQEATTIPVVRDSAVDGLALAGMNIASRAILPLPGGGCLGLLAVEPDRYANHLDFLVILAQIHGRAAARHVR